MKPYGPILLGAWLVLAVGCSAEPSPAPTLQPELTPAQETAYGNRAEFFHSIPPQYRPDLDWRTALAKSLADAEPQWSQGFEELIIRDFFGDQEGGVFVDVGCYLPRKLSTTYDLERRSNWTGVGIDVIGRYEKAWKRVRPRSTFVQAAVSDTDGETVRLYLAGHINTLKEQLLEAWGLAEGAEVREVETATLNTLLEQQGVEKVDFLSMDIEGAELAALKGFDIKRFQPELACIETLEYEAVTRYFESNGYELIEKYLKADKINIYFRRKPEE